jgi:hypothetical protein
VDLACAPQNVGLSGFSREADIKAVEWIILNQAGEKKREAKERFLFCANFGR